MLFRELPKKVVYEILTRVKPTRLRMARCARVCALWREVCDQAMLSWVTRFDPSRCDGSQWIVCAFVLQVCCHRLCVCELAKHVLDRFGQAWCTCKNDRCGDVRVHVACELWYDSAVVNHKLMLILVSWCSGGPCTQGREKCSGKGLRKGRKNDFMLPKCVQIGKGNCAHFIEHNVIVRACLRVRLCVHVCTYMYCMNPCIHT